MKRIKQKYLIISLSLSCFLQANELENYFNIIFDNEKINLNQCINEEGLLSEKKIETTCKASEKAKRAFYILEDKKNLTLYDMLPEFSKYEKVSNIAAIFA